jgi:hypothetical protein
MKCGTLFQEGVLDADKQVIGCNRGFAGVIP